ncbi:asparagine synthase-related protein [Candidatus Viadribacter manganicus]|nr:asparagine synthase-related protein [Candidatus Viadribacter manganicus]
MLLHGAQGAIFGSLFQRQRLGAAPLGDITPSQTSRLVESGRGAELSRDYWGAYLAVLHDTGQDELVIVREAAGAHPIYYGRLGKSMAVFSHAEDFLALADEAQPDFEFLSAFCAQSRLVTPRTAIKDVRELMAGEELCLGRAPGAVAKCVVWAPIANARSFTSEEFDAAAGGLRETVFAVARSWSQTSSEIVHRLSGGLDSSIVLGALKRATTGELLAVNAFPADVAEGDERRYARAAADASDTRLIEVAMSPAHISYERLLDAYFSAKPSRAAMSFTDPTMGRAIAAEMNSPLVTSGQGGDQVFHRLRTPLIAADAWCDGCDLAELQRIMVDTARLARRPIWDVFGAVLKYGLLRQPLASGPFGSRARGCEPDAIKTLLNEHAWARVRAAASPARAMRIAHIMDLQYYHQPNGLNAQFATHPILASQPIIEFCLRVPPYVMTWGGRERALARAAFQDVIPGEVLARTGKGDTTRYHVAALARQLPFMREMLIGGELERAEIIDGVELREALSRDVMSEGSRSGFLSSALLAEIWLRRFYALQRRFVEPGHRPEPPDGSSASSEAPQA